MSMLEGGCYCGAVRYGSQDAPSVVTYCHCAMCRRSVGAQAVAWATFARTGINIRGDSLRWHESSPRALRGFCVQCGTSLFFVARADPEQIDVTVGSLDEPDRCPPTCHIYVPSKVAWLPLAPALPCHVADSVSPLVEAEALER
jgi:hypothetical protein